MSLNLNKQVVIGGSVVLIWLIYTYAAFAYFTNQKLRPFDPSGLLKGVSDTQFSERLQLFSDIHHSKTKSSLATIFHFVDPGCKCQETSSAHVKDIDLIALNNGFNIQTIDVSKQTNLSVPIPSVPSIAILGTDKDFVYYGPYGEGLDCSETAGYAQTILNNYLKGFNAHLMATEAKGCYCKA